MWSVIVTHSADDGGERKVALPPAARNWFRIDSNNGSGGMRIWACGTNGRPYVECAGGPGRVRVMQVARNSRSLPQDLAQILILKNLKFLPTPLENPGNQILCLYIVLNQNTTKSWELFPGFGKLLLKRNLDTVTTYIP